jgi:hypothetical protein
MEERRKLGAGEDLLFAIAKRSQKEHPSVDSLWDA